MNVTFPDRTLSVAGFKVNSLTTTLSVAAADPAEPFAAPTASAVRATRAATISPRFIESPFSVNMRAQLFPSLLHDSNGNAHCGELVAERQSGVVLLEGEHRQLLVPEVGALPLVDHRVEVDQVRPGAARRVEVELDVALLVEAAGEPGVRVVVGDGEAVVELGPADAPDADREHRARFDRCRRHSEKLLADVVADLSLQLAVLIQLDAVPAAEVVRDLDRGPKRPVGGRSRPP